MDLDAPGDSLQLDVVAGASRPAAPGDKRDPERFYCPYPGCNRSFAELWRLKVHYRAPPDIRGSGKERGHGTELTHCPKCGKTLKPGKHHVGCSGGKTAPRQAANKRSRTAAEVEPPDDALPSSPQVKHVRGVEQDVEPPKSWQDFARSHGAYAMPPPPMALAPPLKQEHQDWPPPVPSGIVYGHGESATVSWLPAQVNGFVPQLPPGYQQAQFPVELQYAASAHPHGYQQVPFGSIPGYPGQPGVTLQMTEGGQVLSLPPGGTLQGMPSVPPTLLYQQQQQQSSHDVSFLQPHIHVNPHGQQQPTVMPAAAPAHEPSGQVPEHHQPSQLPNDSGGRAAAGASAGSGGDGTAGAGTGAGPSAPPQQAQQPGKSESNPPDESLGSVFDDVEEFTRDFGRIPSPPPLPADFHSASTGGGGMLFNFSQFGQKLPRSQSHTRLDRSLSAVGLGHLDVGLENDVMYDHTDDGDLMQLLFGVPDELPTMATIHLHKWSNEEDDGDDGAQQRGQGAAGAGAGSAAAAGGSVAAVAANGGSGGAGGGQGSADGVAADQQQAPRQTQQQAQQEEERPLDAQQTPHAAPVNGKHAQHEGADAHPRGHGNDTYTAHGSGSGGKAALLNGMNNQNHAGDEHHRDHLLDAETFRLLQSCD